MCRALMSIKTKYVPPAAERLRWLTGFTGSAGLAVILRDKAALFVDGRYTLQARDQIDTELFEICQVPGTKVTDWINEHLGEGDACGYDAKLHTISGIERAEKVLGEADNELRPTDGNLIDLIWQDRPPAPMAALQPHPVQYAGKAASAKDRRAAGRPLRSQTGCRRPDLARIRLLGL